MYQYIQIAWRNLWRNKRRTLITIASVFFAILLSLLMRSMQLGTYAMMEHDAVKNSTSYIQVHKKGYWNDKTINNTFVYSQDLAQKLKSVSNVTQLTPRLESFALGSSGSMTKGVAVIGTDPEIENKMTGLKKRVIKGKYFTSDSSEALVAVNLAKYLKLDVGDTLVMLSQGFHGMTAAGQFKIAGIVKFPAAGMNSEMVYTKLPDAQYFYAAPNRLTSLSLMLNDPDELQETKEKLKKTIGDNYEVMTWRQLLVSLVQSIESDNVSGMFMLGILYIVVAFGIFGTILMMTMERRKEFAVMVSVGMHRSKLSLILFLETIFIALIGVIIGIAVSYPIAYNFHVNPIELSGAAAKAMKEFNAQPIMPFSIDASIFINQGVVVLIITLLAVIYPLYYINRFNILNALHGR